MITPCGSAIPAPAGRGPFFLAAFFASFLTLDREAGAQVLDRAAVSRRREPVVPEKEGKVLVARNLDSLTIVIDGRLDEKAWASADSVDDLVQLEPDNMARPTERTVVRVLYDDRYVYVGILAYDSEPQRIATGLVRRDDNPPADLLSVGFDPRHDHLTGYVYITSPKGVQRDFFFFDDMSLDLGYDAVWEVRTRVTEEGWSAEYRIPFAQMRFSLPSEGRMVWGFDVRRDIFRKGESGVWVGAPRGARGIVSRWGHLVFEGQVPTPRRVEVLPFTVARRSQRAGIPGATYGLDGGIDGRLGLGSASTLTATVNPDFGQVEVDPAVLNLTVFETFFPEKRPFFVEDSRVFLPPYALFQLFHSRRIGQQPGRLLSRTDRVVERPQQTTILGAAKIAGKGAGWTYGLLAAGSAREYALVDSSATTLRRLAEPQTSYAAARVQRDVLGATSNIGALATAVVRDGDANAFTGGLDYKLRRHRNLWQLDGHWAITNAPGPGGVRTGFGGITNLAYFGKHFGFQTSFDHLGSDFRVNDLGFLRDRSDRTSVGGSLELRRPDPRGPFRRIAGSLSFRQAWNHDQLVFDRTAGLGGTAVFRNFWSLSLNAARAFETLDDLDTRGGPPIVRPARVAGSLTVSSDSRRTTRAQFDLTREDDRVGGWRMRLASSLSFQAWPAFQAALSANYAFGRDAAQWIENRDADGDGQTDFVYGTLRRDVIDLTVRSSYAIHRDLTLQLFLQPFVAVGDYTDIRKLARPRSFEFDPVSLPIDPDFNRKLLRGTFVLRWEYLRGSTLFMAWTRATSDLSRPGVFRPLVDLGDALAAPGTNVWLIKASYWWSP